MPYKKYNDSVSLFRKEAVDASFDKSSTLGDAGIASPVSWTIITIIFVIFGIGLIVFISTAKLPEIESVRGYLRYPEAEARVFPTRKGIISECNVVNNQLVKKGDVIGRVKTELYLSNGSEISDLELRVVNEDINNIKRIIASKNNHATISKELIMTVIKSKVMEVKHLQDSLKLESLKFKDEIDLYGRHKKLYEEGVLSEIDFYNRRENYRIVEKNILDIKGSISRIENEILLERKKIEKVNIDLEEELAQIETRSLQIDRDLLKQKSIQGFAIVAQITGLVDNLECRVGDPVNPNIPLMTIIPKNSELMAELMIKSTSIPYVKKGLPLRLKYDAFPFDKYGVFDGEIKSVSTTVVNWYERNGGSPEQGSFYVITASINDQKYSNDGREFIMKSGMKFTAELILTERTILDWLLKDLRSN